MRLATIYVFVIICEKKKKLWIGGRHVNEMGGQETERSTMIYLEIDFETSWLLGRPSWWRLGPILK